eukprot:gene4495-43215_t
MVGVARAVERCGKRVHAVCSTDDGFVALTQSGDGAGYGIEAGVVELCSTAYVL